MRFGRLNASSLAAERVRSFPVVVVYHGYGGKGGMLAGNCKEHERQDYIEDLWNLLHHSDEESRLMMGLTTYLDDSGSDDGSPLITCGGLVMSRLDFKEFSQRWQRMYARHRLSEPPLHMSDFVGHGKHAGLRPEFKRHLFLDVAKLVNDHKLYSLSVAISQTDFNEMLSREVRRNLIGSYAFAFLVIVLTHQGVSGRLRSGPVKTAYLVDRGFGHQDQLNKVHEIIVRFEKALGGFRHTGALDTDSDDNVPALQAADAISWASRKTVLSGALQEGFEPLADILRHDINPPHQTIKLDRKGIQMLAAPINAWISGKGELPRLTDIVSRNLQGISVRLKKITGPTPSSPTSPEQP